MKKLTIILFVILLPIFSVFGQFDLSELSDANKVGISNDTLKKMDAYFHKLVDEKKLAGIQTAILRNGKLIHFDSYGYADIENDIPLDHKSIFRLFSMTKPIVSVALMQLYDQGKFKLEDPLHLYIPEFKETYVLKDSNLVRSKNSIKIIDLLRHTSGYNPVVGKNPILNKYYLDSKFYLEKTNQKFVKGLSKVPLEFEPGTNFRYGLSTSICGYLIEVLSGQSLEKYLTESVLKPLKMNDTHFQLPKKKTPRFVTYYGWNNNGLYVSDNPKNSRYIKKVTLFQGSNGLVSTAFDYLRFCQMLLNKGKLDGKRILKESTVDLMLSDQLEEVRKHQTKGLKVYPGEASFGLGFAIRGKNVDSLENVFGWGGAAGTYFKIDLDRNLAYLMMIQISHIAHNKMKVHKKIQEFVDSSIVK